MSRRKQIVLRDPVDDHLTELAARNDIPPASLAAQLVEDGLARAPNAHSTRPERLRPPATTANPSNERPPWLEPYEEQREWRLQMWGAIAALHSRYPTHLQALSEGWWKDEATLEMLCALVAWRDELDQANKPPETRSPFKTK